MIQHLVRALSPKEQRLLWRAIAKRKQTRTRALLRGPFVMMLAAATLAALTLLASNSPPRYIIGFWLAFAALMSLRLAIAEVRESCRVIRSFSSALRAIRAEVTRITTTAVVELEEVEEEGACYAFALTGRQLVFA
jgi:hypothetical protein